MDVLLLKVTFLSSAWISLVKWDFSQNLFLLTKIKVSFSSLISEQFLNIKLYNNPQALMQPLNGNIKTKGNNELWTLDQIQFGWLGLNALMTLLRIIIEKEHKKQFHDYSHAFFIINN